MENTQPENNVIQLENKSDYVNLRFKKPKLFVIALGVAALFIVAAILFAKGVFVAATANGSPISRLAVIQELEKQGGKQVLDSLINKKLIEIELDKQNAVATKEEVDEEIKKIEEQLATQGGTLDQALAMQGMTREKFVEQVNTQKKLEKILADKITVTEAEIDTYMKESKVAPAKDVKIEDFRKQVSDQLRGEKFQKEAEIWVSNVMESAKIKYYKNY